MLIDRDAAPEIPKRFSVSAYPSILVLGPEHESVWRWSGFEKPDEFLGELDEALRRFALFEAGEPFDLPPERPAVLLEGALVETWPAPSDDVPWGVERLGGALWAGRGKTLFELDPESHEVRRRFDVGSYQDLCTDGTHLWLLPADWTSGGAIRVLDPANGETVREVVTADNEGRRDSRARGLAWFDGKPWVLEIHGALHALDPESGAITTTGSIGRNWVYGLCATGDALVTASREGLHWIDPTTQKETRTLATHYWIRGLGFDEDRLLCQEQPVFGFDLDHRRVRWYPEPTVLHGVTLLPEGDGVRDGELGIDIVCDVQGERVPKRDDPTEFELVGRRYHCEIGGARYDTPAGLRRVLRILGERAGETPVVIAPKPGSTYGDVAEVVDAVAAAGFETIEFR